MKTQISFFVLAISATLWFTSCNKDDEPAKPQINNLELGSQDSRLAILGSDLHVEAEIIAEGKISTVQVLIHTESEGEDEKSAMVTLDEGNWEFDSTYTEFSGLKNTTFHKHIDIPVTADTGVYHFHLIVTDMEGYQTMIEEELEIQQPTDAVFPVVTIATAPTTNQAFTDGQAISISGSVSDDIALGGIYIGLVRVDQGLTDAEVNDGNTITLLHNHDFPVPASYNFSASIVVGAAMDNNITPKQVTWDAGDYYIVVKCKDAFDGNWTFSSHYPVVIN